jgi:hypothetical protein
LTRQFGQANVHQATIPLGEGDNADGTVVYSDDPTKRLEVVWKDQTRRQPATIIVKGTESVWAIAPGISLGTSLVEIERLNGGPFTLAGFGFDYSGTIVEWQGGRLASLRTRLPRAFIRLEPVGPGSPSRQIDEAQVRGDREFSSGFGPMQRLNPGVYEFIVSYEAPLPAPLAHRMGPARPPASAIAR